MNINEFPQQVNQVISIAETILQDQILGIYLYGSATMNGLRPDSDIDILIITKQELSNSIRADLTKQLLKISGSVGCIEKRPLEVTIINQSDIVPLQFPPKCQYMYGEWLRGEMEAGEYPQACNDPDIMILLWQARKNSITLKGAESKELIPAIPFHEIKKAIRFSLPGLISSFKGDERNVLLTLSRMWFTLVTEEITTKDVAAKWVILKLPERFPPLLTTAKEAYLGNLSDEWETVEKEAMALVEYMKKQIEELLRTEYVLALVGDECICDDWIINPAGTWTVGGAEADCGLTGRKIVCDQYGGFCRVGGGAFSGKDPSKVDRSASYMAHKIACDLLEKFDLEWCEVQIGYAIGMSQPVSLSIRNDADMELFDYVTNTYDLTPAGIIRELDLLHADYETIAEGCHFYNKYNRTGRWK